MLYPYISNFNWIDILILIFVLRMCYIGIKRGFGIELFKITNLFFCSFVALHFYILLGEFIHHNIPPLPVEPASIFSFVCLIFIIAIIFRILREGFFVFFKSEITSTASKTFGLLTGALRGVIVCGVIMYGLLISNNHYLDLSVRTSIVGSKVVKIPVKIYESLLYGAVIKVFPDQSFNQEVIKVLERKPKKQKKS